MGQAGGGVDWETLRECAVAATANSYSPYSNFPVGVAGFADDGRVVSGANVENASYGITLCAECSMVSALYATGGGRITALRTDAGETAADLDLWMDDDTGARLSTGTATVAFPG